MERGAALLGKVTFVIDRGYDGSKMFLRLNELGQDYIIRLKAKRELLFQNMHFRYYRLAKGVTGILIGRTGKNRFTGKEQDPLDKAYYICQTYNRL